MQQDRKRHAAPRRTPLRDACRRFNRGDLAILFCGVLAFLSFTLGAPLFHTASAFSTGNSPIYAMVEPGPTVSSDRNSPGGAAPMADAGPHTAAGAHPVPASGLPSSAPPAGPELPAAAPPVRIRYPSAAFDVAIHPLDLDSEARTSRTIEPPATKDGYWLTPFGVPGAGSGNTTYVIGHSWEGADAPFNHLSSAAAVGDHIEVETAAGTISYRVDSITTYLKSGLKDSPVWDMVPNRLVLISCYTEDPWGKNVVVTAYPADPQ